jgi:hypothetical protein
VSSDFVPETLNDLTDYYLILDLKPDASPSDIREAYLRSKATYQKDNVALYTLIDGNEREDMLRRIEEAYQILSNPDRRREYDRYYGQITVSPSGPLPSALAQQPASPAPKKFAPEIPHGAKIISIDRTAPMESFGADENPLEAPRTDVRPAHQPAQPRPSAFHPSESAPSAPVAPSSVETLPHKALAEIEKEITEQTEWSGAFIRRVREARGVSLEEVMQATKITKAYVLAIEEENYAKLPAAVFIRGFVGQLARLLKLPHQQVSASYMVRLQRSCPEKFR